MRDIYITGNIASGKSTLTQLAGTHFENSCYIPEPYESNPFLPVYLKDQKRWAFTATIYYFYEYARELKKVTSGRDYRYHFIDAGTWTNKLVYAEYSYGEHMMNPDEYAFYQTLSGLIEQAYEYPETPGFIFVNASPQTCWARMHQRGWDYQTSSVQLAYIEKLHGYFEAMKQAVAAKGFPILEISSETIDYSQPAGQQEVLALIQRFLEVNERANS